MNRVIKFRGKRIDFGDSREWCGGTMDEVLACFREHQQIRLVNDRQRINYNSEDLIEVIE